MQNKHTSFQSLNQTNKLHPGGKGFQTRGLRITNLWVSMLQFENEVLIDGLLPTAQRIIIGFSENKSRVLRIL